MALAQHGWLQKAGVSTRIAVCAATGAAIAVTVSLILTKTPMGRVGCIGVHDAPVDIRPCRAWAAPRAALTLNLTLNPTLNLKPFCCRSHLTSLSGSLCTTRKELRVSVVASGVQTGR